MGKTRDGIRDYLNIIFGKSKINKLYDEVPKADFRVLSTATKKEMISFGATPLFAEKLVAVFRIRHASSPPIGAIIKQSSDCIPVLRDLNGLDHEQFHVLLLNQRNAVIRRIKISEGGIAGTVVDVKKIFRPALLYKACAVILAHNHPSGNVNPSKADIEITKKIKEAGKYLDITVLDHIIIGCENESMRYTSFGDEGLL
jgi:DNA repair protein RadC